MQLEFIRALQETRSPALTYFFELVTILGSPQVLVVFLPFVFWCISTGIGFRVLLVVLLSAYINSLLKDLGPLYIPSDSALYSTRPYLAYPDQVWTCRRDPLFDPNALLARLCYEEESRAFPSGHAQVSIVAWSYFALIVRRPFFSTLAAAWVLLIGLSRMYLGQHWPTDVLGGWLIGIALLLAALAVFSKGRRWPRQLNWWLLALMWVILPLLLIVDPDADFTRAGILGLLAGTAIGYPLQQNYVPFAVRAPWPLQVAKAAVGVLGIVVIQIGLKAVLPEFRWVELLLGALTGVWALFGAPLIYSLIMPRATVMN